MKFPHFAMAAAAATTALGAFSALAQNTDAMQRSDPVRGESIYVQPIHQPSNTYHGGYFTEQDALLFSDAVAAIDADRATNTAVLTMVANNGVLTVNGSTADMAQSARIEAKLKALHGGTRVYAWFDSWSG